MYPDREGGAVENTLNTFTSNNSHYPGMVKSHVSEYTSGHRRLQPPTQSKTPAGTASKTLSSTQSLRAMGPRERRSTNSNNVIRAETSAGTSSRLMEKTKPGIRGQYAATRKGTALGTMGGTSSRGALSRDFATNTASACSLAKPSH